MAKKSNINLSPIGKSDKFKTISYVILYISLYLLIQAIAQYTILVLYSLFNNLSLSSVVNGMKNGKFINILVISSFFSTLVCILLFIKMKWFNLSLTYLKSKYWTLLLIVGILGISIIIPIQFFYESLSIEFSDKYQHLFNGIINNPMGYIIIGIIAPIGEEVIFRGTILHKLLSVFNRDKNWIAIFISAIIFGLVHGNYAQGIHAFFIGILLGWMFYRTNSIIPGIILHWVNNTVPFIIIKLYPNSYNNKLLNLFQGNEISLYSTLIISLIIFIVSLYYLKRHLY